MTATRIALFVQSLQVHPAIAAEVFMFATGMTAAATAGQGEPDVVWLPPGCPRTATSLIFLMSGCNCAVVKVTSTTASGGATTGMVVGRGGGEAGNQRGGHPDHHRALFVGVAVAWVRQSRRLTLAELPSPILAVVLLPPAGGG